MAQKPHNQHAVSYRPAQAEFKADRRVGMQRVEIARSPGVLNKNSVVDWQVDERRKLVAFVHVLEKHPGVSSLESGHYASLLSRSFMLSGITTTVLVFKTSSPSWLV